MADFSITAEGFDKLAAELTDAGPRVTYRAVQALEVTARRVRDDARRFASGLRHAPHYPRSITYDVERMGRDRFVAEIGPEKSRPQGALGNLLEYGSVNNAPISHLGPALDRNGPDLQKGMELAVDTVLPR